MLPYFKFSPVEAENMYEAFIHAQRACFCTACNVIPEDDVSARPSTTPTLHPTASHLPAPSPQPPLAHHLHQSLKHRLESGKLIWKQNKWY